MITLYTASVENLPDPRKHPACLESLGKIRQEKTLRFIQEKDRKLSLGAGLLLHKILPIYGKDICDIYTDANEKPLIQGLHFNLSHSEERILLAISDSAIGCDIEKIAKASFDLAEHFFCPDENNYLSGIVDENRKNQAFFRLWTVKESYVKMTGEGLGLPLNSFEARLGETAEGTAAIYQNSKPVSCFVREYTLGEYQAAVCAEEKIMADEPKIVVF